MPMTFDISKWIRELRGRQGLNQGELATLLGAKQSQLSAWETGKNKPSAEYEAKLMDFARQWGFEIPVRLKTSPVNDRIRTPEPAAAPRPPMKPPEKGDVDGSSVPLGMPYFERLADSLSANQQDTRAMITLADAQRADNARQTEGLIALLTEQQRSIARNQELFAQTLQQALHMKEDEHRELMAELQQLRAKVEALESR